MNKNIFQSFKIVALALTLSVGISYVSAWTAPTATPPGGNTVAPLNTGGTAQTKTGNLSAWALTGNSVNTNTLKVVGGAAANRVLTSDAAGNATWQPAGAGNTYTAGNGLTLTGNQFSTNNTQTQARVSGTCAVGQSIRAISSTGAVTCEADDVGAASTYTAGNGLTLTGNQFSTNNTLTQARVSGTCAVGQSIRAISSTGAVTCEIDDVGAGGSDNLGNHTATQNLNMAGRQIYGLVGGNSLSWGATAGAGNSIYSDGANGNIGIRASGAVYIQNQPGTALNTLYTGYTYNSSTIDAKDYWIRDANKWASQMGGGGAKAWVSYSSVSGVLNSYGVGSVTPSTYNPTVNLSPALSSANYAVICNATLTSGGAEEQVFAYGKTASSFYLRASYAVDPDPIKFFDCVVFGN
ncbi:MAG TPA: hypothetical protein DCS20_04025 [Candidatus Yonathbacteria bacterium]|nr:hypothetical protein [Candidatus Yonathbacteria bacterium]